MSRTDALEVRTGGYSWLAHSWYCHTIPDEEEEEDQEDEEEDEELEAVPYYFSSLHL